jgi:hypothetical protein
LDEWEVSLEGIPEQREAEEEYTEWPRARGPAGRGLPAAREAVVKGMEGKTARRYSYHGAMEEWAPGLRGIMEEEA